MYESKQIDISTKLHETQIKTQQAILLDFNSAVESAPLHAVTISKYRTSTLIDKTILRHAQNYAFLADVALFDVRNHLDLSQIRITPVYDAPKRIDEIRLLHGDTLNDCMLALNITPRTLIDFLDHDGYNIRVGQLLTLCRRYDIAPQDIYIKGRQLDKVPYFS